MSNTATPVSAAQSPRPSKGSGTISLVGNRRRNSVHDASGTSAAGRPGVTLPFSSRKSIGGVEGATRTLKHPTTSVDHTAKVKAAAVKITSHPTNRPQSTPAKSMGSQMFGAPPESAPATRKSITGKFVRLRDTASARNTDGKPKMPMSAETGTEQLHHETTFDKLTYRRNSVGKKQTLPTGASQPKPGRSVENFPRKKVVPVKPSNELLTTKRGNQPPCKNAQKNDSVVECSPSITPSVKAVDSEKPSATTDLSTLSKIVADDADSKFASKLEVIPVTNTGQKYTTGNASQDVDLEQQNSSTLNVAPSANTDDDKEEGVEVHTPVVEVSTPLHQEATPSLSSSDDVVTHARQPAEATEVILPIETERCEHTSDDKRLDDSTRTRKTADAIPAPLDDLRQPRNVRLSLPSSESDGAAMDLAIRARISQRLSGRSPPSRSARQGTTTSRQSLSNSTDMFRNFTRKMETNVTVVPGTAKMCLVPSCSPLCTTPQSVVSVKSPAHVRSTPSNLQLTESSFVSPLAEIRGDVSIGRRSFIHPSARIDATLGKITIGANCVIEELVVVISKSGGMDIGDYTHFEIGAVVEHVSRIGGKCSFGIKCKVSGPAEISSRVMIGPGCTVISEQSLPKYFVVGGSDNKQTSSNEDQISFFVASLEALLTALPALLKKPDGVRRGERIDDQPPRSKERTT